MGHPHDVRHKRQPRRIAQLLKVHLSAGPVAAERLGHHAAINQNPGTCPLLMCWKESRSQHDSRSEAMMTTGAPGFPRPRLRGRRGIRLRGVLEPPNVVPVHVSLRVSTAISFCFFCIAVSPSVSSSESQFLEFRSMRDRPDNEAVDR